ncbi:hypothetical protein DFQ27_000027 [Actinomortierella ambigua]|uniref:Protein kinase domain-containing protein n=1 Tax=Actinomortierella ambigua TaxID=1343610 RepID=A0A9P6QLY6_9FUNG|nr:hypothetical protein DFQ27_000027 [Actinomortierella ambigua]
MGSKNTSQGLVIGEFIGAGAFGEVFQGRYNTCKAAIKKFRLHQHTADQIETIEREIGVLKRLQCRYIIQFYGVHRQGNEILLVTDFAEGGSLKKAIEESRVADWHVKSRIAQEIAYGLAYIHHEGTLHRDLKSDNVLLSGHMEVKLCDFGLAVAITSNGGHSTDAMRGTFRWLAPELVVSKRPRYTTKSDMYALGMVMWEMAAMNTLPFRDMKNNYAVAQAVHGGERERLPDETPAFYQHWVDLCWKQGPSDRPDAHEVKIVDDGSSRRQGTTTLGSSWRTSIDNSQEQGMVSAVSSTLSSVPGKPRTVQRLVEFFNLRRLAMLNHVDAQVSLAEIYETGGDGVPKNNDMAFDWYLRAAEQGHLDAMGRVGDMYAEGRGTRQNDNEAVRWRKKVTEQRGSNLHGGVDIASPGGSQSVEHDAGDKGSFRTTTLKRLVAMKSSSGSVMNVLDTNQYRVKARKEIQAAEGGDAGAQFNVGLMYKLGQGVKQSDVEAAKWYTKAANQGNQEAQNDLGRMYECGQGVEQSYVEAVKWYAMAASQEDPEAQYNLGRMYEWGRGVKQIHVEAVKWYAKAANQENPGAQDRLGWMYKNGHGVEWSDVEAVKWYTKAANQGNSDAQRHLGCMYTYGHGVEKSDVEAAKWYAMSVSSRSA